MIVFVLPELGYTIRVVGGFLGQAGVLLFIALSYYIHASEDINFYIVLGGTGKYIHTYMHIYTYLHTRIHTLYTLVTYRHTKHTKHTYIHRSHAYIYAGIHTFYTDMHTFHI